MRSSRSGQLTVRDAAETLKTFMRLGRPDRELFEDSVGALIRDLSGRGAPLRIYGEMVNLLAAEGDYRAAHELEELWNDLGRRSAYRLFCGYAAAHFGDPRTLGALRRICASHSQVLSSPQDVLGSFLVTRTPAGTERRGPAIALIPGSGLGTGLGVCRPLPPARADELLR